MNRTKEKPILDSWGETNWIANFLTEGQENGRCKLFICCFLICYTYNLQWRIYIKEN